MRVSRSQRAPSVLLLEDLSQVLLYAPNTSRRSIGSMFSLHGDLNPDLALEAIPHGPSVLRCVA